MGFFKIYSLCAFRNSLLIIAFAMSWPLLLSAQTETPYHVRHDEAAPLWVIKMYEKDPDPGTVIKLYEEYYRDHTFIKNQHTQYYKRWISGLGKVVTYDPVHDPAYLDDYHALKNQRTTADWSPIGPIDWDHDAAGRSYAPGSAHIYTVEQSISSPNVLYAGTANSGVWKTENLGLSWIPLTDDFITSSVTAIEIDPFNDDIVYAGLLNTIYKTTNGGSTWATTGNAAFQALSLDVKDIRAHPEDAGKIFAATHNGFFRTLDAGIGWTNIFAGDIQEIEFHPNNPDTIYIVRKNGMKTEFFRSLNGGNSFTQFTTGWPNPNTGSGEHQERTEIAVTPDAPDNVYALATGSANGGSGLYGVYKSTDRGATWTFTCCGPGPGGPPSATNPNLMGWSDQGLDDGGQYYYDLAFGVSPYNKDSMWVCGVNLWVSANEGSTFVCPSAWSHSYKPNYVHADIHDLHYMEHSGDLWVCGDGGIFYSHDRGANFYRRNIGILGSDFWGFGQGHWNGNVMVGGAYHNGTLLKENDVYINGWICTDGGDGVGGYVNPGYDKQVYTWFNMKDLQSNRTIEPQTRDYYHQPNSTYITGQSSDLLFHPHYYGTWYTGSGNKLYKTTDNGFSYEEIYNFGVAVASMDICLSNPEVLYACTFPDWWGKKRIYRSANSGVTWTEITPSLSIINAHDWIPYDIVSDPENPLRVWIARTSMYGDYPDYNGYKIFKSENGGSTWINITGTSLNGQFPSTMIHQRGTNGGLYVGTRRGVYYRNAIMPDWSLYNNGLPARVNSVRLAPWYRMGKIRNATDRSVWESNFYEPSEPIAIPAVQKQFFFCNRDTAHFTDLSVLNETGASWSWNFPGGTPATSTSRNPKVVYSQPGIYDVTLIVSDVNGTDSATINDMVVVDNRCQIDTVPGGALKLVSHPDYVKINDLGITSNTITITAWVKPSGIQTEYTSIFMNDGNAAGFNFRENNNTLAYHWPGGQWWWDSNLTVPADQWSYVAIVVQPGSVTLYVNGYSATHFTAPQSVELGDIRIGSYQGWESRAFKGEIDEVCLWTRALTQDEIRTQRHLTKNPVTDPTIRAYFQFDENINSGFVINKALAKDGVLNANAHIVPSTAAVGSGTSQIKNITSSGLASFDLGGDMDIEFGSTHPNGKVVVSHLRVDPDTLPSFGTSVGGQWIINNYGSNQNISAIQSLSFKNSASLSNAMASYNFDLFKRGSNTFGPSWVNVDANSTSVLPGINGTINLTGLPSLTSFSQFVIMRDQVPSGLPDISITTALDPNPHPMGGESMSLLINSDQHGIVLPVLSAATLNTLGIPVSGQMAFLTDSLAIIYFNGTQWIELLDDPRLQNESNDPPNSNITVSMGNQSSGPSYILSLGSGFLKLPAFTSAEIITINDPAEGMLIFDSTISKPRLFNGQYWQSLAGTNTALPVSSISPVPVAGFAVNQNSKHALSVLELNPSGGKALQLPLARSLDIYSPVAGLLTYDTQHRAMMLFDGVRWNILK